MHILVCAFLKFPLQQLGALKMYFTVMVIIRHSSSVLQFDPSLQATASTRECIIAKKNKSNKMGSRV